MNKRILLPIVVLVLASLACGLSTNQPEGSLVGTVDGEKLFQQSGCSGCHSGNGGQGPSLAGIYGEEVPLENGETVAADEAYLRESILDPSAQIVDGYQPIMPEYGDQLNDEQVDALVAYIRSLSD